MSPLKESKISNNFQKIIFRHTSSDMVTFRRKVHELCQKFHETNFHNNWSKETIPKLEYQQYFVGDEVSMTSYVSDEHSIINPVGRKVILSPLEGIIIIDNKATTPKVRKIFFDKIINELNKF